MAREPNRTHWPFPDIDAMADRGAHRTFIHNASDNPRRYQGRCQDCDWRGDELTGLGASNQMLEHTRSTLPKP
jgi:hypothetical protein